DSMSAISLSDKSRKVRAIVIWSTTYFEWRALKSASPATGWAANLRMQAKWGGARESSPLKKDAPEFAHLHESLEQNQRETTSIRKYFCRKKKAHVIAKKPSDKSVNAVREGLIT